MKTDKIIFETNFDKENFDIYSQAGYLSSEPVQIIIPETKMDGIQALKSSNTGHTLAIKYNSKYYKVYKSTVFLDHDNIDFYLC